MSKFLNILFGDPNKKVIADLRAEVEHINKLEPEISMLSDEALKHKTIEFREMIAQGRSVDSLLYEAFAVVREASKRTLGQRHFDVQLMGGIVLYRGMIAEMRTGEGKTLTSTLALYVNALEGKGCHLVTVNDYLARRDAVWMGQIFHFLGMSVGVIQHEGGLVYDPTFKHPEPEPLNPDAILIESFKVREDYLRPTDRRSAYAADITYGTNNQYGFDYLRDNMAPTLNEMVMRGLHFAIVDEIDSILIDEARTPLIISAPAEKSNELYVRFATIVAGLTEKEDYNVDEKLRTAAYTDAGVEKIEKALGIENLYAGGSGVMFQRFADSALRARANYQKDVHYVVQRNEVLIVDEFTGRLMEGRRFSEGIHQAIEAKEGVTIQNESQTLATITFQNYFRMYSKLSGMTGTAATEAEEFSKIYKLEVTEIPTNLSVARKDLPDRVFKSELGKFEAVIREIKEKQWLGQPVLVGTASVEKNELLSELLTRSGVKHEILNAKNHAREGEIIAQAGRIGSVTVATNMAGRGVDIKLGGNPGTKEDEARVRELGGLHVLGTERHESRRIDNQLRGRSGRQGDPGSTQFYISMEDDLMRIFGSDRAKGMMDKLGIPDDMPIENGLITSSIEKAQVRVEGHNFDLRKHLLEYDDVLNKHREVIYSRRLEVLDAFTKEPETLKERILDIVEGEIEQVVLFHTGEKVVSPIHQAEGAENVGAGDWNMKEIIETVNSIVTLDQESTSKLESITIENSRDKQNVAETRTRMIETIMAVVRDEYRKIHDLFEVKMDVYHIERATLIRAIDMLWIEHLSAMTSLRTGIGLRGYGQRDPLIEYKREGYDMFQQLLAAINQDVTFSFFRFAHHAVDMKVQAQLNDSLLSRAGVQLAGASTTSTEHTSIASKSTGEKVGRNDPCPCGSGKKYKKCHGG
ncbi:preprotein translocase subunit SecA [Candidatus Uhrbacteria bacterium RIFCSPHIGHO2_02_FULL_47_44]|uniref:Protein translocase subunit SecA n=1 Tax=Candidatus Uhrbacteria bacterium RIFCSPLOWO2_02_FULL_48_18 TaxID=1802408 RepID=A0A1F7VBW3_9BACT|nr:MAG: preprotein translocase subunit SecA [Candidatus Uhrbacteria bacterium RIFCSPHIGHO2_01_FULL_47_10]OGL70469.1 MAG: preprotein translocase subunit SecA [Candidatus Uhrbacteria bacterium RIFCSPHIGHO2_02_FULL_47_44]OGL76839.1 MAG: preprotein translocase subunit SecA [Candidatus Uhrbacteria bacterium RIFCSPHIGHO2_12_FULL_47_12]OGL82308.1 MAG: preprotein translocase subunit SecA [Candidatus Uhrbacteria bacterium RIFCSPLOWO2_01_FULL_47_17]OGL87955.1 MAG: preprotein translocase subunit SecA [Can